MVRGGYYISKTIPDAEQFIDRHRDKETYAPELNIET